MTNSLQDWKIEKDSKGGARVWEFHEIFNGTRVEVDNYVEGLRKSTLGETYHFRYTEA